MFKPLHVWSSKEATGNEWRIFVFLQCKTGKKIMKKINFINLFGEEEKKKIIF